MRELVQEEARIVAEPQLMEVLAGVGDQAPDVDQIDAQDDEPSRNEAQTFA